MDAVSIVTLRLIDYVYMPGGVYAVQLNCQNRLVYIIAYLINFIRGTVAQNAKLKKIECRPTWMMLC